MTRWKASAIHLGISAGDRRLGRGRGDAAGLVPEPLFTATGGNDLVMILVAVDVVLGPLITLIVFNPAKPLQADRASTSTVIAVLQLAALAYGIGVIAMARPCTWSSRSIASTSCAANELARRRSWRA